jgi:hypothetical protein
MYKFVQRWILNKLGRYMQVPVHSQEIYEVIGKKLAKKLSPIKIKTV